MKRPLPSSWRSCLTPVSKREGIQAPGQTGSRKNSRSAMPSRLPATPVPMPISRVAAQGCDVGAPFDTMWPMTSRLVDLSFDANDPLRLAQFWAEALGWPVDAQTDDEVGLVPRDGPTL